MRKNATVLSCLLVLAALGSAVADAATVTRTWNFKPADAAGLTLDNLVGDLRIEPATDGGFQVTATIIVDSTNEAEAERLARAVEFRTSDAGRDSSFQVRLPALDFPVIHVAGTARGSFLGRSYVNYLGDRRQLTGDRSKGVNVRVDLLVRVPEGTRLVARNRIGEVSAEAVLADLEIDTARGPVAVRDGRGKLEIDIGSGSVDVARHEGEVDVDTGSGAVRIVDSRGRIAVDTGSGSVRISGGSGEVDADTGSGAVVVENFAGSVKADTGSGSVTITGSSAARVIDADTGSGRVRIEGDLSSLEQLKVDTGSGGTTIIASALPPLEFAMATGSGGIEVEVPGAEVTRDGRRRAVVRIGEAKQRATIQTGSGSITLRLAPPIAD
jgi:hypothetical protein